MKWFDVGEQAQGVFAIGQVATGVVAIGQMATGVIAIGQVARGFVAVGQGAVGLVALGQGSIGLFWAVGMLGIGGRGFGLVIPTVPDLGERRALPAVTPVDQLREGQSGWQRLKYEGQLRFSVENEVLPARIDSALVQAVDKLTVGTVVYGLLKKQADGLRIDRLMQVPVPRIRESGWWAWWGLQLLLLLGSGVAFWLIAGIPILEGLFGEKGVFGR